MCDFLNKYLSDTWNRDKVMAIAQFLPMMLANPVNSAGCASLAKSLSNLSQMADSYRAVTRLSLLTNALSRGTLHALAKPRGDIVVDRLEQLGHLAHVFFCIFENTAVFAGHGVFPRSLSRFGGCAVTCWFYTLLLGLVRQVYLLTQKPNTEEEKKRGIVTLVKLGCFFIFSMTCIPKDGPMLLENGAGVLTPVHNAIRLIAPKHIALDDSIRGALGFIASVCDFY